MGRGRPSQQACTRQQARAGSLDKMPRAQASKCRLRATPCSSLLARAGDPRLVAAVVGAVVGTKQGMVRRMPTGCTRELGASIFTKSRAAEEAGDGDIFVKVKACTGRTGPVHTAPRGRVGIECDEPWSLPLCQVGPTVTRSMHSFVTTPYAGACPPLPPPGLARTARRTRCPRSAGASWAWPASSVPPSTASPRPAGSRRGRGAALRVASEGAAPPPGSPARCAARHGWRSGAWRGPRPRSTAAAV